MVTVRAIAAAVVLIAFVAASDAQDAAPPKKPAAAPPAAKKPGDPAKKPDPAQSLVTEVGGKSFEQWKSDLTHSDASTRVEAILAMISFGPIAAEVVPLLVDRTKDTDASPRVKAIIALTMIDVARKDVPKVIDALAYRLANDNQAICRFQAAHALLNFADDPACKNALPAIIRGTEDLSSYEIRSLCVSLLRRAGRDVKTGPEYRVSQALIKAALDKTSQVRLEAAISLGGVGKPADSLVQQTTENTLSTLTRDRDKAVCVWAQVGLLALTEKVTEDRVTPIGKHLASPDARIRLHSARALGAIGDKAKDCLPALIKAINDKEADVAMEACMALGQINDPGQRALTALTELMAKKELDESVKIVAKAALEQMKKAKK